MFLLFLFPLSPIEIHLSVIIQSARLAASFGGPLVFLFNKYIVFSLWIDAGQDTAYVVVLSSIAITCLLWVCVALLTKPEPEEKLVAFYRQARPMGWWGPIADKAGCQALSGFGPIGKGLGIAMVGAIAVGCAIIAILHPTDFRGLIRPLK